MSETKKGTRVTYTVRTKANGTCSVLDPQGNVITDGIAEIEMAEQEAACLSDSDAGHYA